MPPRRCTILHSLLVACQSGPQIVGRWEATTSRDAGLDLKADATFTLKRR